MTGSYRGFLLSNAGVITGYGVHVAVQACTQLNVRMNCWVNKGRKGCMNVHVVRWTPSIVRFLTTFA
jgi:hypothetical protein